MILELIIYLGGPRAPILASHVPPQSDHSHDSSTLSYTCPFLAGHEELRLRFRLRTGSAGLFEDKKRCRMCTEDRCVLCDSGEVEEVKHFLVRCEEFRWERQRLVERIGRMEGTQEWLEEYWRAEEEGKMALLLGRSIQGDALMQELEWMSGYGRSAEVVAEAEGVGIWRKSLLT